MNDDHEKELLDKTQAVFRSESLIYEFSPLDRIATEEEDVKSILGNLK